MQSKKDNCFSLLIVSHSNDIKQLKVPTWIPKLLILFILCTILSISYLIYSYNYIKTDYTAKVKELNSLKEINKKQKNEIKDLKMKTEEIEKKLASISELEKTIKDMVGLKDSKNNETTRVTINASRGGSLAFRATSKDNIDTAQISSDFDNLSELLDQSKEDLAKLKNDVKERLRYLEAKPDLMPTWGRITSGFGYRKNPFGRGREFHYGIDISNKYGTSIKAAGTGVVTYAGYNGGYGKVIMINHGYGYQTVYGHNNKLLVRTGERVKKGQVIAKMGNTGKSTGPHLHFEIRYYGKPINPKNILNNFK
ncbi:hypothetical protein BET03_12605 [Thermohalobacter berrensis]|uniref:M23ase beta-sheet core domain-containing protein n=1 Tax=Thermohalobacter berrensis TaxID=99594 RepID=A0A419T1Y5_9FIRM|nr:hypothetical protein BET03_12605 [Thermohalobacter berrensis]